MKTLRGNHTAVERVKKTVWWKVVNTTRHLIAHPTQRLTEETILVDVLITNMRNLYKLYGIDIAERKAFKNYKSKNTVRYSSSYGRSSMNVYVGLDHRQLRLLESNFENMKNEFTRLEGGALKATRKFGKLMYLSLGVKCSKWRTVLQKYK